MDRKKVLIIGGKGYFGTLLREDLLRYANCDVALAGPDTSMKGLFGANIAICTFGPFQEMPAVLVKNCLEQRVHYIDIADSRDYVLEARLITDDFEKPLSAVCTGWSTVSALSGLLAKIASEGMDRIDSIYIHMAPGNRGARRKGTISSLLHSVGETFTVRRNGEWRDIKGWSEPRDFVFPPPVGKRRGYLVDVPDHALFPRLFNAWTVEFRAGSELTVLNSALSVLAGLGGNWDRWTPVFRLAAAMFSRFGHDWGAIGVEVAGSMRRRASIVAEKRAERMAVMPASIMVNLLSGGAKFRGVVSPTDWLTRDELQLECEKRGFRLVVEDM